jgi:hypothetical protein
MNSDAQRARNKRKRDKLKAKKSGRPVEPRSIILVECYVYHVDQQVPSALFSGILDEGSITTTQELHYSSQENPVNVDILREAGIKHVMGSYNFPKKKLVAYVCLTDVTELRRNK